MPWMERNMPVFPGVGIQHEVTGRGERLSFYEGVADDLVELRRLPRGKVLFSSIASASPTNKATHFSGNQETRSITFPPKVHVVIIPKSINYVASGYRRGYVPGSAVSRTLLPSSNPAHNPPDRPFYQDTQGISTEGVNPVDTDNGRGTVCVIRFSNAFTAIIGGVYTPSYITLGHELIHALHMIRGDRHSTDEEVKTIGLGVYRREYFTENALRHEAGLPQRTSI